MKWHDMAFVAGVRSVEVDGNLVDVIELADERLIAIDGDNITLFEDLERLIELEDDAETERPSIAL